MQTTKTGLWFIALDLRKLDMAMKRHGVTSYRDLAQRAGISQTAIYTATRTGRIRDTAAGKIAFALHTDPQMFSCWKQAR